MQDPVVIAANTAGLELQGPSSHLSAALGTKKRKRICKKTEVDENGKAIRKRGRPRKSDDQKIRDKLIREAKKAAEKAVGNLIQSEAKKTEKIRVTVAAELVLGTESDVILDKVVNILNGD